MNQIKSLYALFTGIYKFVEMLIITSYPHHRRHSLCYASFAGHPCWKATQQNPCRQPKVAFVSLGNRRPPVACNGRSSLPTLLPDPGLTDLVQRSQASQLLPREAQQENCRRGESYGVVN